MFQFNTKQISIINRLYLSISCDSNEWDESKHPRSESGKFRKGTVSKSDEKVPAIKGNELGSYKDIKELRVNARLYAIKNLAGKNFLNGKTKNEILVTMSGIKHTLAGAQDELIKTIPAIPDIIRTAELIRSEPDKHQDPNVIDIEIYQAELNVMGVRKKVVMTVKHWKDGRRYYDHGYIKNNSDA